MDEGSVQVKDRGGWVLDRWYVGEREALISLVSIVSNPSVIEARNEEDPAENREEQAWKKKKLKCIRNELRQGNETAAF